MMSKGKTMFSVCCHHLSLSCGGQGGAATCLRAHASLWPPPRTEPARRVELDEDLPAHGQHFCIACSRYFINEAALQDHLGTKPHRR